LACQNEEINGLSLSRIIMNNTTKDPDTSSIDALLSDHMRLEKNIRLVAAPFIKRKLKPLLYISYGVPKSGSTLVFEITRRAFEVNGIPQYRLSDNAVCAGHEINFVRDWNDERILDALLTEAEELKSTIVIKTHRSPSERIKELANDGLIVGHIVYRDPRDIALSMLDHGRKARKNGEIAFSDIRDIMQAMYRVKSRLEQFYEWLEIPKFFINSYEDMIHHSREFETKLKQQTGLEFNLDDIVSYVRSNRFTQFNKGVVRRFEEEMSESNKSMFYGEFEDFISKYISNKNFPD